MEKQIADLQAALENKKSTNTTKQAEIEGYKKAFAETAKAVAPERSSQVPDFKFVKEELSEELRSALATLGAEAAEKLFAGLGDQVRKAAAPTSH
eukprot:3012670-Pyramimonas_sp.AAC.2